MIYVPCVKVASTAMKGNTLVDHEYYFVCNAKKEIPVSFISVLFSVSSATYVHVLDHTVLVCR